MRSVARVDTSFRMVLSKWCNMRHEILWHRAMHDLRKVYTERIQRYACLSLDVWLHEEFGLPGVDAVLCECRTEVVHSQHSFRLIPSR